MLFLNLTINIISYIVKTLNNGHLESVEIFTLYLEISTIEKISEIQKMLRNA